LSYKSTSITLAALLCATLLQAENTQELQKVSVVSAAGFEQKLADAPASISVITKEDLEKKPYNNLVDALRYIEGIDIGETNDKTNNGTVSIRGMGSDYTLILIDGKRQNNSGDIYPNSFEGAQLASIPPLSMIERIEVIRGPMSTLYGSDAMGGVVNIITKKISNEWVGGMGYAKTIQSKDAYGNDDKLDLSVMGPIIKDLLGVSVRGSLFNAAKSNPTYAKVYDQGGVDRSKSNDSFGAGKGNVQSETYTLGAGLTLTPNSDHTIRLDYDLANQSFDNNPYLTKSGTKVHPLGTGDSLETIWTNQRVGYADKLVMEREQYSLSWDAEWALGKSTAWVHHIQSDNDGRSMPLDASDRLKIAANKANNAASPYHTADWSTLALAMADPDFLAYMPIANRELSSSNTIYYAKYELPLDEHYIVAGVEYQDVELKDGVYGMSEGKRGGKKAYYQYGIFVEDNYNIIDPLVITFGARYDKHEDFGKQISPRAYAAYSIGDSWTIKGGVATGYKAPKASDLQEGITGFGGQGTSPWIGNPDLKPEKSISYEAALYYESNRGDNFNITVFQNDFKDKIDSSTDLKGSAGAEWALLSASYGDLSQKQNVGKATIRGVELATRIYLLDDLALSGNWTYLDSEIDSDNPATNGKPLRSSPKHQYNATIEYKATPQLSAYLQHSGEIDRFNTRYLDGAGKYRDLYYKDFSIFNLGATYKFSENFSLIGRINNLFDKDYLKYSFVERVGTTNRYKEHNNKPASRNLFVSARYTF